MACNGSDQSTNLGFFGIDDVDQMTENGNTVTDVNIYGYDTVSSDCFPTKASMEQLSPLLMD